MDVFNWRCLVRSQSYGHSFDEYWAESFDDHRSRECSNRESESKSIAQCATKSHQLLPCMSPYFRSANVAAASPSPPSLSLRHPQFPLHWLCIALTSKSVKKPEIYHSPTKPAHLIGLFKLTARSILQIHPAPSPPACILNASRT